MAIAEPRGGCRRGFNSEVKASELAQGLPRADRGHTAWDLENERFDKERPLLSSERAFLVLN